MIMPPILTALMDRFGLSRTFIIEAAGIVILIIVFFIIVRDTPEKAGVVAHESSARIRERNRTPTFHREQIRKGLTVKESLALNLAILFIGMNSASYTQHLILHYVNTGYTAVQAAAAMSVYGGVLIFGKIFFGLVSDSIGTFRSNYFFISAWAVASLMTAFLNGSAGMLFTSAVINGIGVPIGTIGLTVWCSDFSSDNEYSRKLKNCQVIFSVTSLYTL